jgi:heat shock protein HslJ
MKYFIKLNSHFVFLPIIFLLAGCPGRGSDGESQHVYWVNSQKVPCVGSGPQYCLMVQKNQEPDPSAWSSFYSTIKGFDFEPGYIYKLLVEEKELPPDEVPADASSIEYTLVRVLEKFRDKKLVLNHIWILENMERKSLEAYPGFESHEAPQLEIKTVEMQYAGSDGCNRLMGGLIELDESVIRFGVGAGTRMACPQMEIPDLFNGLLPQVTNYRVQDNRLNLFNAEGEELMRFIKPD